MRHICSSSNTNSPINNESSLNYFRLLLVECQKKQKKYEKKIRQSSSKIEVSRFYVEYLKSNLLNASQLKTSLDIDVCPVETFKSMFNLYLNYSKNSDDNKIEFEFSYNLTSKQTSSPDTNDDSNDVNQYLVKSLSYSINSFHVEQFKSVLDYFNEEMKKVYNSIDSSQMIIKFAKFFKSLFSDIELNNGLKEDFSTFIQRV